MNIRLYNARILTMEKNREIFEGEIWIQDEKILYVGNGQDTHETCGSLPYEGILWDKEMDCGGNLDAGLQERPHPFGNDAYAFLCG